MNNIEKKNPAIHHDLNLMTANKTNRLKTAAKILLIVSLISIALQLATFYQTKYQLESPFVPQSTVLEISTPFIFKALISTIACVVGLIFYFYSEYLFTVIILSLLLMWQQVYHFF